jgi:hypothetical protein
VIDLRLRTQHAEASAETGSFRARLLPVARRPPIRILAGYEGEGFTDASGAVWQGDRFFQAGDPESIDPKPITSARDSAIYLRRRRGTLDYDIPVGSGNYELRLHFADAFFGENNADGGGELSRLFDVKCNGVTLLDHFDLIEDAGGSNTADAKVFEGIHGDRDGRVHLKFISLRDVAFINAIELLPTDSPFALPIRIVPSHHSVRDRDGQEWSSDEYYRGGVIVANERFHLSDANPWELGQRVGNFQYSIPAPGHYNILVSAPGFETFSDRHLPLELGQLGRLDAKLTVGSVNTEVVVNADESPLQTDTVTLQTDISPEVENSLPILVSGGPRAASTFTLRSCQASLPMVVPVE